MTTEHIKMPDVTPLVRYVADGVQTQFIYPFPIFAADDLEISFDGAVQASGFTVVGAGQTAGGTVSFDSAPSNGVIVKLERRMGLERLTDFLEGGDFSAQSINTELDYLVGIIQQVNRDLSPMLRYSDDEAVGEVELPPKATRANMVLGFDGDGDPVAVSTEGTMAAPDFTASGTGAVTRTSTDKFGDFISVKDFGAVGDGVTDDTLSIQQALAAYDQVFVPAGTYLVTGTIALAASQSLFGEGQTSIIKANSTSFNTIEVPDSYITIRDLRVESGAIGIKLYGGTGACVQNNISNVVVDSADTGIQLDGADDANKPCYWNNFDRVLVSKPGVHGVHLTLSGAGDTPNANHFHMVRVYSHGAGTTGNGFYVEAGKLNNSFIDCEANVNGATAASCFRIGADSNKTILINPYAESNNGVPNVVLDSGSVETILMNLTAQSDGAAIDDNSGGDYDAVNAGYPDKNRLRKTVVTDLKATLMRFDTELITATGTTTIDTSHSIHLADAYAGVQTIELPTLADAIGQYVVIKKIDNTSNIVTVTGNGSELGPDGKDLLLGGENDYVMLICNGAEWFIIASNRIAGNTRYIDSTGTVDIDMTVDTYLLSSFSGAMTARLPPANAAEAVGRTVTLKKTDVSANAIMVTEQGGNGPDQSSQSLASQYDAITVVSNGGQWYIVSTY